MKEDLEERLEFLGLTETDRRLLAELRPLLERHADRLVSAFYRHLLSFDATRRHLVDPVVKDRLLAKQREYLLSLGAPETATWPATTRRRARSCGRPSDAPARPRIWPRSRRWWQAWPTRSEPRWA